MKRILFIIMIMLSSFVNKLNPTNVNQLPKDKTGEAFVITDVSKDCLSNSIHIFYEDKYEVFKSYYINDEEIKPIREGKYNYDITKIINNIENYNSDKENYMNYQISINGKKYLVAHGEKNELREFMDSINGDTLLWCE